MFFGADDGSNGFQLWRTDGTADGTTGPGHQPRRLRLDLPQRHGISVQHQHHRGLNGRLFFSANDGPDGSQLWTSLGTASTTRMLTRIVNGTAPLIPDRGVHPGNGFRSSRPTTASTGASSGGPTGPRGTSLIKDIRPGHPPRLRHDLTAFDGKVIFTAATASTARGLDQRRDPAGTFMLKDINPGRFLGVPRSHPLHRGERRDVLHGR